MSEFIEVLDLGNGKQAVAMFDGFEGDDCPLDWGSAVEVNCWTRRSFNVQQSDFFGRDLIEDWQVYGYLEDGILSHTSSGKEVAEYLGVGAVISYALGDLTFDHLTLEPWQSRALDRAVAWVEKNWHFLPLTKYEHGSIRFYSGRSGCRWDSGQVGYIVGAVDKFANFDDFDKQVDILLENLTAWANGEVYQFAIIDEEGEVLDSLGGRYGYPSGDDLRAYAVDCGYLS